MLPDRLAAAPPAPEGAERPALPSRRCPPHRRQLLRLLRGDRRGVSAVEFALVLPLLLVILLGAFDLGNAFQQSIRLEAAARAGAQFAFSYPQNTSGIRNVVRTNLSNIPSSELNIQVQVKECRCDSGSNGGCNSTDCVQPAIVSISVSRPFRYVSGFSEVMLPNLSPVKGNVEIRLF